MTDDRAPDDDRPHDVLAAEEFMMPAPDPELEPAHDVLAADEFSVPAGDPTLRHGPVDVPGPPFGDDDPPHDVLAAEEFAMPAGRVGSAVDAVGSAVSRRRWWALGAGAAFAVRAMRRRRR